MAKGSKVSELANSKWGVILLGALSAAALVVAKELLKTVTDMHTKYHTR